MSGAQYYDDAKLRHDLGYRPVVDIGLGLERTVAWLELHELTTLST